MTTKLASILVLCLAALLLYGYQPRPLTTGRDNEIICFTGDKLSELRTRAKALNLHNKDLIILRELRDVNALILEIRRKEGVISEIVFHTVAKGSIFPQAYRGIQKGDEDFDLIAAGLKNHFGVADKGGRIAKKDK